MPIGERANTDTGTRSVVGSMPSFSTSWNVAIEFGLSSQIEPSGDALATWLAPVKPPAPGRLSTTKGWLNFFEKMPASARVKVSFEAPGPYGTTSVTGLVGHACC